MTELFQDEKERSDWLSELAERLFLFRLLRTA